jgi:hypothetical protein
MPNQINDTICPLCQANNNCGINSNEPCWCTEQKVPKELIAQVQNELINKCCICKVCIQKFNLDNAKEIK